MLCLAAMATRTYRHTLRNNPFDADILLTFITPWKLRFLQMQLLSYIRGNFTQNLKKSLLSSSTECIKGIYNPFCRDFARTLDIGRRKSSLSKNGLFTVCCLKMHTNIILHTYLHTLPYVQEKQWNCKKNVLTKNLVSQKLSNPSLNELKFKKMPFRMA